jgi:hypothetical protein
MTAQRYASLGTRGLVILTSPDINLMGYHTVDFSVYILVLRLLLLNKISQ